MTGAEASGLFTLAGFFVGGIIVLMAQGEFRFKRRKESLDLDLFRLIRRIEAGDDGNVRDVQTATIKRGAAQ